MQVCSNMQLFTLISLSFKLKMCCKIWYHIDEAWNLFAVSRYIIISSRFHVSVITNYSLCGCMLKPNLTKVIPSGYLDIVAISMMHIQMLISPHRANLVTIKRLLCHYLFDKLCKTLTDATAWIHGPLCETFEDPITIWKTLHRQCRRLRYLLVIVVMPDGSKWPWSWQMWKSILHPWLLY
jgi:hypothetical protein